MVVQRGSPDEVAVKLGKDAALVVTDRGYLRIQKEWRERVAEELDCKLVQVEDNVVVPVDTSPLTNANTPPARSALRFTSTWRSFWST